MSAAFRTADNRTTGDRLEVGNHGEHLVLVISGRHDIANIALTPTDAAALAREIVDPAGERERGETMMERNREALRKEIGRSKAEAERRNAGAREAESIKAEARKLHETRKRRAAVLEELGAIEDAERREARKARK